MLLSRTCLLGGTFLEALASEIYINAFLWTNNDKYVLICLTKLLVSCLAATA